MGRKFGLSRYRTNFPKIPLFSYREEEAGLSLCYNTELHSMSKQNITLCIQKQAVLYPEGSLHRVGHCTTFSVKTK